MFNHGNRRFVKIWLVALAALLGLLAGVVSASSQEYAFDIAKKYPAAFKVWKSIVPQQFKRETWIYGLNGTATPMDTITLDGTDFLYGKNCKPHDCGGNFVAFLIAKDGMAAYGGLASAALHVDQQFFGAPDAEKRALLIKALAN